MKKGQKMSQEQKDKISKANKGKRHTAWNKGKKLSKEHIKNLSESHKGIRLSEEAKRKVSEFHRGRKRSEETKKKMAEKQKGDRNSVWKGDFVGYSGLHKWIRKSRIKKGKCEHCGKSGKTEWANIDHAYRRVLEDFIELCPKCHLDYDVENKLRRKSRWE